MLWTLWYLIAWPFHVRKAMCGSSSIGQLNGTDAITTTLHIIIRTHSARVHVRSCGKQLLFIPLPIDLPHYSHAKSYNIQIYAMYCTLCKTTAGAGWFSTRNIGVCISENSHIPSRSRVLALRNTCSSMIACVLIAHAYAAAESNI